jgi:hypothetical protein
VPDPAAAAAAAAAATDALTPAELAHQVACLQGELGSLLEERYQLQVRAGWC